MKEAHSNSQNAYVDMAKIGSLHDRRIVHGREREGGRESDVFIREEVKMLHRAKEYFDGIDELRFRGFCRVRSS